MLIVLLAQVVWPRASLHTRLCARPRRAVTVSPGASPLASATVPEATSGSGKETSEIGRPQSVGKMASELLAEMFERAMASDIARLDERMDKGELQMPGVVAKVEKRFQKSAENARFQKLETQTEKLSEEQPGMSKVAQGTAAPSSAASTTSMWWRPTATASPPLSARVSPSASTGSKTPHLFHFRGWSRDGAPPSTIISRVDSELFNDKIHNIAGELFMAMSFLLPCVANHQISYRISVGVDLSELCKDLTALLEDDGMRVHGEAVKHMLEQSIERERYYTQFMDARDLLRGGPLFDEGCIASFTECQRGLRLFRTGTWEILASPSLVVGCGMSRSSRTWDSECRLSSRRKA